jgi:hypothetical protein
MLDVATLLWEECEDEIHIPEMGTWESIGTPKLQSSMVGVKTPRIEKFFISLESYQSVENGLAWAIWTFVAQVMVERKAGSQTGSLTPDHQKSIIDSTPMRAGGVRHVVEKLSTRATSLLETSSQSEVWAKSYDSTKWQESKLG